MRTLPSHMNGGSHHEFNQYDPPFIWEEGVRIYGTPGVHNNFSNIKMLQQFSLTSAYNVDLVILELPNMVNSSFPDSLYCLKDSGKCSFEKRLRV